MSALSELLDQAVQKCDPSNDAALAARLGVSRSAVSLWRKGEGIREKYLTQLIALVGADPEVAVMVLREQATTHAERAVWGALARKLGAAAVVSVAALLPMGNVSATNIAETTQVSSDMHYAKWRRWLRATARGLHRFLSRFPSDGFDATPALLA